MLPADKFRTNRTRSFYYEIFENEVVDSDRVVVQAFSTDGENNIILLSEKTSPVEKYFFAQTKSVTPFDVIELKKAGKIF